MHEHSHVDLFLALLHDYLAHAVVSGAEQDSKFELTDIPLAEAERVT
jgi:hypothetical protein